MIVPDVPDFKFLRWLHPHNNVAQRCLEIRRRRVDLSRVISIVFIKLSGINVVSIDDSNNVVRFSGADVSKQ